MEHHEEYTESTGLNKIDYKYLAKGFYFVAGVNGTLIEIEVKRDGARVPESSKGADVYYKDGRSYIKVDENRLYRIIDDKSAEEHLIEIIIPSAGLKAFALTFG